MNHYIFHILILTLIAHTSLSCLLVGNVEGNCVSSNKLNDFVDICGPYLADYVCVPFNDVIWKNWTNATVNNYIYDFVINQLAMEFKRELDSSDMHLVNNSKCLSSFLSFICKTNFKKCDPTTNKSFDLCFSLCMAFTSNCGSTLVTCSTSSDGILPSDFKDSDNCYS